MNCLTMCLAAMLAALSAESDAPTPIDHCESAVISQARAALDALHEAERVHRISGTGQVTVVYEGTRSIEAHLMRPGMLWTVPVRLEVVTDTQGKGFALRESTGHEGAERTATSLMLNGRVAAQAAADKPFVEQQGAERNDAISSFMRWQPASVVRAALDAASSCRPGQTMEYQGLSVLPVTFSEGGAGAITCLLDGGRRVVRVESLLSHQYFGDACEWTRFDEWESREQAAVPRRVTRLSVQSASTTRYDLSLVDLKVGPAVDGAFALPKERIGDIADWGASRVTKPEQRFVSLAPGLWSIEIAAADSRVLVIERPSDLVLLGAPDGDAVCGDLVTTLHERFPGKPIGAVALSHHHPSPVGGLRAIAATGATIIVPRALESFTNGVLARPTSLGPPAVPGPAMPKIELFDDELTLECGSVRVRLIDIAEHSAHAFSYVVFYFPEQGIIFEHDLGYFSTERDAFVNRRLTGLVDRLEALHIEPKRLIQAWPVRGVKQEVEWAVVDGLVKAQRRKQQTK